MILKVFNSIVLAVVMFLLASKIPFVFTSDAQVAERAFVTLKMLALVVLFDGMQISGFGLMRSVGAQKHGLLIAFVGFYCIASSISYPLLLKTDLKIFGFWIGYCAGALCMFVAQMVYLTRLDWTKTADVVKN